jgi:hypothetical protein
MIDATEHRMSLLLGRVLDGVATDAEREEFRALQTSHSHLLEGFIDTLFTHNLLLYQSDDISEFIARELVASEAECRHAAEPQSKPGKIRTRSPHGWWAAAAVLLVVVVGAWWTQLRSGGDQTMVAQITAQSGVVWSTDSTALRSNKSVGVGRLATDSGSFTLQFSSGPTVNVVAPASLDIASPMLVVLDRGQATARVPESGKGFAIKTPVARVVDQGTEFGVVARDDGMTDVIVFEGRVDVHEMAGAPLEPRSLIIGEAARIDKLGSIGRIVEIGRNTSGQWWTGAREAGQSLIASVNDNIVSDVSDMFTCYQTTYGGLQDDALAYGDNPHHQWNGLTGDGLPEFLRAADYIKTFNDYRYRQDYKLTLEIAKPTNLYVFADNRIPAPAWLAEQFEDTGVDIGLDEGPWLYQAPNEYRQLDKNTTAAGGGKSIDNTFSVWHRRCVEPGPVVLGDAGKWATEGKQGRAMYGIAATPLVEHAPQAISAKLP